MEKKDGAATHKAPPRAPLELVTSTGFGIEKDSLRLNPQSEGLCGARLKSPLDLFTRFTTSVPATMTAICPAFSSLSTQCRTGIQACHHMPTAPGIR